MTENNTFTNDYLTESILNEAHSITKDLNILASMLNDASSTAEQYIKQTEHTATLLKEKSVPHIRTIIDDLEKAVKLKIS